MKGKITWLMVSIMMGLSLVVAACAPAVVERPEVIEKPKPEVVEKPEVVTPVVEKPKYGGVLNLIEDEIVDFDDIVGQPHRAVTMMLTNEPLVAGDWAKGPAGGYGSNETSWPDKALSYNLLAGYLAESWEFPKKLEGDRATLIFHIRKGVHWALNSQSEASRLVGGREMTADDVLFSLKQVITDPKAYIYRSNKDLRNATITSPAPWTVKVEVDWGALESGIGRFAGNVHIVPPEVVAKYGTMLNWRVSVGTGPWILTNFVPGSSATFVRNPNYWMKNPVGPGKGDQLPYMDGVKFFIITDKSTQLAALRTGKVDGYASKGGSLSWDEGLILKKTAPPFMIFKETVGGAVPLQFKLDRPPFNDIRVRRAMHMAIDFEVINNQLFEGRGLIHTHPIDKPDFYPEAYLALDDPEMPQSVRELYVYNPEKAKQLLAEAGYPQGFKTNLVSGSDTEVIDYFSIYKDYWRKIGVEVELRPKEAGALSTIMNTYDFEGMIHTKSLGATRYYELGYWYGEALNNQSQINDPMVNEAFAKIQSVVVFDRDEAGRIYRELQKYALDQVWGISVVSKPGWLSWPVWLKNYSGEKYVSFGIAKDFYRWVWIDQELKKSLGY